jgi:hypothetical protein
MIFSTTVALAAPLHSHSEATAATISPFNNNVAAQTTEDITSIEVVGVGISVEMLRQSQVWQEMQKHPKGSALPADLSTYPTNVTVRDLATEKRSADVMEWGASRFVEHWPIPSLSIWPRSYNKEEVDTSFGGKTNFDFFNERVNDLRMPAGMHHHKIISLGAVFRNEPEDALERAFQFFEQNPEVPVLLLYASDGDMIRGLVGDESRKQYWEEGPRRPDSMAESMVSLLLVRRDRIDALRPFVRYADGNQNAKYFLERDRQLAAARAAARVAGKPEPQSLLFRPSKFLPAPWTEEQMQQFDGLPTIAVLHRPVRVSYRLDKHGKPTFDPAQKAKLMHEKEQQAAFKAGFEAALRAIPGVAPARVFYDTAGPATGRHVVPLSLAMHGSLPALDLFKPDQGYDIYARLGNTGAASPFVQWALASIAAYRQKGASITVNLRQAEEATITVVTPGAANGKTRDDPIDFNLSQ